MDRIKIGYAENQLSAALAAQLSSCLQRSYPELTFELTAINNTREQDNEPRLAARKLERALMDERIDLAVYPGCDLPLDLHPDLPVIALSARIDARDALVFPEGQEHPDFSKPIGCAQRRQLTQLSRVFPDCVAAPVAGTVQQQLALLEEGRYGALVISAAEMEWLGLGSRIGQVFCVDELIPEPGQGSIAVQAREDFDAALLECFHSWDSWDAVFSERELIRALEEESGPVAAYAEVTGQVLTITGLYVDEAEQIYRKASMSGDRKDAGRLGFELAAELKIG